MRRKWFGCARWAFSALVLVSLLAACAPAATPPTPTPSPKAAPTTTAAQVAKPVPTPTPKPAKVVYPIQVVGATFWPLYVMQEKGFARTENIELEFPVMRGEQTTVALVGKSVDISNLDVELAARAIELGENLSIVGGMTAQALYTLIAAPDIKTAEQLKGKKFAVPTLEGTTTTILQRMLGAKGLKKGDYDLIVAGGSGERWAALKAGGVQAAILTQPLDLQAMAEGYNNLMFSTEVIKDWQFNVVTVRKDWPKGNPDNEGLLVRFIRALSKACRWLNDSNNKQEAVQILVKITKTEEKFASQTYDLYVKNSVFPKEGEINMSGMKEVLNAMGELGTFKGPVPSAEKFLDMSYWEKATGKR